MFNCNNQSTDVFCRRLNTLFSSQIMSVSQIKLDGKPEYNKIMVEKKIPKNADGNTNHKSDHRSKPKSIESKTYKWEIHWLNSILLITFHIYAVYAAYLTICGRVQVKTLLYCKYSDINMHMSYCTGHFPVAIFLILHCSVKSNTN